MRKTNVGGDTECVVRKISPALEVVAHCSLHRKLSFSKLLTTGICLHLVCREDLHDCAAYFTSGFAAILVRAHENRSCAKVIPRDLVIFFTFCPLRNDSKTEYIVVLGNGINTKLNRVNIFATHFTCDIAIQLESPASNNCAERIENHPHRAKCDAHNVAFGTDLTAEHHKFKEPEMICVFGIIVLAHKIGE